MNKFLPFFVVTCTTLLLINCGQQKDTQSGTTAVIAPVSDTPAISIADSLFLEDLCPGVGIGNFIIDPAEARDMIGDFKKIFVGSSSSVITTFWVDKCSVISLAAFLSKETARDGAWITSACAETADNATTIFIVPTRSTGKNHPEEWDTFKPAPDCAKECADYFTFKAQAEKRIAKFESVYRENGKKDSLTSKVWVDKCVFKSIVALFTQYSYLDGINIEMAAYDKMMPGIGQIKPIQSTIVIVPTKPGAGGKHENDWDTQQKLYTLSQQQAAPPAYNHGQLCPSLCP
jgi:hypothetical protein